MLKCCLAMSDLDGQLWLLCLEASSGIILLLPQRNYLTTRGRVGGETPQPTTGARKQHPCPYDSPGNSSLGLGLHSGFSLDPKHLAFRYISDPSNMERHIKHPISMKQL